MENGRDCMAFQQNTRMKARLRLLCVCYDLNIIHMYVYTMYIVHTYILQLSWKMVDKRRVSPADNLPATVRARVAVSGVCVCVWRNFR